MNRDIVQFVNFNAHEYDKTSLTRATLEEIPDQLVDFFYQRGIMPQPGNKMVSTSKIVVEDYNEEADIDLSMDYTDDGEIVLNGDQPAAYIDNSYEGVVGGLHVMPPPSTAPQGYNPHASPAAFATVPAMTAPVPQPVQPFTFQVQVPPGVSPGMQLQVAHPQTGQALLVTVPQGVPPGGVFSVSA